MKLWRILKFIHVQFFKIPADLKASPTCVGWTCLFTTFSEEKSEGTWPPLLRTDGNYGSINGLAKEAIPFLPYL